MSDETTRRKDAHLDLCARGEVEPRGGGTLFDEVQLVHGCLPELAESQLDTSTSFLGKRLRFPLLITGMTGGTERGRAINLGLARVAEALGIGFAVGSQRAMAEQPETAASFRVREVAPRTVVLGNLGLAQASQLGVDGVRRLTDAIDADAVAIHLNAAQELIQPEGERGFDGGLRIIAALAEALGERLLIKETGCGIGPSAARRLVEAGVRHLDVSGAGGTSWVRVEALRASGRTQRLGERFADWGIPTAPCVHAAARAVGGRATINASGGVRDGLMAAKALALGADLVGLALPVLRAWESGGEEGARAFLEEVIGGLKLAMVLTGSRTPLELRGKPAVLGARFRAWSETLATEESR
jgi:isopentenyl-diphosphate delta-isomerase